MELTNETNCQNRLHRDELTSYAVAYDTELRGIVEVAGGIAADVAEHLEAKATGRTAPRTEASRAASVNQWCNLLHAAMGKREHRDQLRTMHVGASIHAGMRWDKARQFKPNDWHDFGHATLALTYCDAFLTERPLHDLVTAPKAALDKVNGCRVRFDIASAVELVREISRSRTG